MAQGFTVTRKGLEATFERDEVALLRELIRDLLGRIEPPEPPEGDEPDPLVAITGLSTEYVEAPTDPVLARLFPAAHASDALVADEFRQLADVDQKAARRASYSAVLEDLAASRDGTVRLGRDQAETWLRVINDLRLATGTIADVTEEWDHDVSKLQEGDPRSAFLHIYDWLTWLQSRLLSTLIG